MTYKELKSKIKEEQKELALRLKRIRPLRKPAVYKSSSQELRKEYDVYGSWKTKYTQQDYRSKHIAYCTFFNNTPYELIETPRDNNKPNTLDIEKFRCEWKKILDEEVVHLGS